MQTHGETEQRTRSSSRNLFIKQIYLRNLLSFGPDSPAILLGSLNVLIGPNGSGKSNLIEAITLLRSTPGDLNQLIRKGGGVEEWIWKGSMTPASLDFLIDNPRGQQPLRHVLSFSEQNRSLHLEDERIENEKPYPGQEDTYFYYRLSGGKPVVNRGGESRRLSQETVDPELSILAQRRDPEIYPEISYLIDTYAKIRVYREWVFGRNTPFREPQKADGRSNYLEEDFSNLGLFLKRLRRYPPARRKILGYLSDLYEGLDDFDVDIVEGNYVQIYFTEGDYTIPATRLSDGTLRYLCLLAILCDPDPPPLVCLEEPELGLHPDILPKIADLLTEASYKTQLIVSTHSDILVDALSNQPEVILVCEKKKGQTEIRRLSAEDLDIWLEEYSLGELWTRGDLGGVRW